MNGARRLGLLGGTFDPIHNGHVDAADAARRTLDLDQVLLIPAHDPPHKPLDPHASPFHRFALAALAGEQHPWLRVSDVELQQPGPSYTVNTLRALHADGWQASQLFFILGADAFAEIAAWWEFPAVMALAHFVVVARPGTTLDAAIARTPELGARVRALASVREDSPETGVVLVEARTRDISSTVVRARIASQQPIDDLVPATVARHIVAHQLYGAVNHLHGKDERI